MKFPENYIMAYLLWFVSTALTILSILAGRVLLMTLVNLLTDNYWRLSFADRTIILLLGLFGLGFVLYLEYLYRQSVGQDQLWLRFFKITVVQLALIVAGGVIPALISWANLSAR